MLASSDLPDYTLSNTLAYCWYINTPCNITSKPNLGLLKVSPFNAGMTQPYFDTTVTSDQCLTNIMNFLYSLLNIRQQRIQSILFKAIGLDGNYYYHLFITSTDPISLDFFDFTLIATSSSTSVLPIPMGHILLLNCGYMQGTNTKMYLNYAQELWVGDDNGPKYVSSSGTIAILEYFSQIVAQVNIGNDPFFTDAELAFFDSEDADFGEMPVTIDDPDQIISEIFDENKDISYFCKKYPNIMESYSQNLFALISFSLHSTVPYFATA